MIPMENNNLNKALDNFLQKDDGGKYNQEKATETIKTKDGLIERIDKTYITEDNKILLKD
jgi:hypothetical protein